MTDAFTYSNQAARKHGPSGYSSYPSYRGWLRDEFKFRCVYCLLREEWGRLFGDFDLDHFLPQVKRPELSTDYENLVYACHTCNLRKSGLETYDPETYLLADFVKVYTTGRIVGLNANAEAIIAKLGLDSPKYRKWRLIWIRNVDLAKEYDFDQYKRLLSFPADLPDLAKLAPESNSKPFGVNQSYHPIRSRGELSDFYIS